MMKSFFLIVAMQLLFIANAGASLSETPNLKFGNPTKEELEMRTYAPDTSAAAVVLCNLADVYYDFSQNGLTVIYEVKKRIKVLKSEGTDVANVKISYANPSTSRGWKEDIYGLKATAWNMEDGKVKKVKMENSMVFDERVDKMRMLKKFTIPQVKPGTVIEYEYRKTSDLYMQVDDWYAQSDIPTAYAHYKVEVPEYFSFSTEMSGFDRMESSSSYGSMQVSFIANTWATQIREFTGRNLPAIKDMSYCWCASQYADRVTMELSQISIPGRGVKNFSVSWGDVDKQLNDSEDFGARMRRTNPLRDEMKAAGIEGLADFDAKLAAVCKLLFSKVKWNSKYALYGGSARDVLKDGTANNADMNFILINMLRDLGMKAEPVLLRLRSNGRLPITHPSIDYLNTFVVGVAKNDSTIVYLDGSAEHGYINCLPAELLAVGHPMNGLSKYELVNVADAVDTHVRVTVDVSIAPDNALTASVVRKNDGLQAIATKEKFANAKDSADYVRQIGERYGMTVVKYSGSPMREFSPQTNEKMVLSKTAEGSDMMYVSPMEFFPVRENPFVAAERKLPVDFDSRMTVVYKYMLHIPEGYAVEEMPKSISLKNDDGSFVCRFIATGSDNAIALSLNMLVKKTLFSMDEYAALKTSFDEIEKLANTVIVLKKK